MPPKKNPSTKKQGTLLGFFKPQPAKPPDTPPTPKRPTTYDLTTDDLYSDGEDSTTTTNNNNDNTITMSSISSQSSTSSSQSQVIEMESSSSKFNMHGLGHVQRSRPRFSSQKQPEQQQQPSIESVRKKPRLQPVIRQTVQRPAYGSNNRLSGVSSFNSSQDVSASLLTESLSDSQPTYSHSSTTSSQRSTSAYSQPSTTSSPRSTSVHSQPSTTSSSRSASVYTTSSQPTSSQRSASTVQSKARPQFDYVAPNFLGSSRFGGSHRAHQVEHYKPPSSSVAVSSEKPWETSPIPLFNKTPTWEGFGKSTSLFPKKKKTPQKKTTTTTSAPVKKEYAPQLSQEQQRVLDMVIKERKSVFFTGSAGTGKSVLMRAMINALKSRFGEGVAVTASTGIAACNISGCTLHSFGGIGMGQESLENLIKTIDSRKVSRERWEKTKVLIIDEISMVDAALFDKLEAIARHFCQKQEPFGGLQLIVTGDFFQLPPVKASGFAFEAKTWPTVMKKTVVLTHVFRQKDQVFIDVLNEMRIGRLSPQALELFKSLNRPLPESKIEPAELYPLRRQVEQSNNTRLDALTGPMHEFKAFDSGKDPKKMESCIAPSLIRLKKNAQVMLLKNMDSTLVNGSLGIVVGFVGEGKYNTIGSLRKRMAPNKRDQTSELDLQEILMKPYPVVRFADDREIVIENDRWSMTLPDGTELANRTQIPLILAWAMSIHKSQGQTLERVKVDLGQSFEDGMAYVALSRATSLHSLQIINFNPQKVTASPKVAKFYQSLQSV